MARLRRSVCTEPGCPELTTNTRCTLHARQQSTARGTRQQQGYDADHDRLRRNLTPLVASGAVLCWRCQQPIPAGAPWDLGHDDTNRQRHAGPEHRACNRATSGRDRAPNDRIPPGG